MAAQFFIPEFSKRQFGRAKAEGAAAGGHILCVLYRGNVFIGNGDGIVINAVYRQGRFSEGAGHIPGEHQHCHKDQNQRHHNKTNDLANLIGLVVHRGIFDACGLVGFVDLVGIHHGQCHHGNKENRQDIQAPISGQEGGGNHQKTANEPDFSGKPVGFHPVFFVLECPSDLDAQGAILLDLGHIIAHKGEQNTQESRQEAGKMHFHTKGHPVQKTAYKKAEARDDPEDNGLGFLRLIVDVLIKPCDHQGKNMHSQQNAAGQKYDHSLTALTVGGAVNTKVSGHCVRQFVPQKQACQNGKYNNKAGKQ